MYKWWNSVKKVDIASRSREKAIERGDSMMDAEWERTMREEMNLEAHRENLRKAMINYAQDVPVWDWAVSVKGLGNGTLLAQLLAQIDDIGAFATVSKLWRFAGWAVIDGQAESRGSQSYNRMLKGICWNIAAAFVMHYTPLYRDIYDAEKERLRELHPEKVKVNGKWRYNDGHLDMMARRKMIKIFLQHLWVVWREMEGLPVTQPWVIAHGGHADYIPPPNWPMDMD